MDLDGSSKPLMKTLRSERLKRCLDWVLKQNLNIPEHSGSVFIKEDDTKSFSTIKGPTNETASEFDCTKPRLKKVRADRVDLECEWNSCKMVMFNNNEFRKHIRTHLPSIPIIEKDGIALYVCQWVNCKYECTKPEQIVQHIAFHAYHSKLLGLGFMTCDAYGSLTCNKDPTNRYHIPEQPEFYKCLWADCELKFNDIQDYYDHASLHARYANGACSWAGCGLECGRNLIPHIKSHTGERTVACPFCGRHFVNRAKLREHLERQQESNEFVCSVCNSGFSTLGLLRTHARVHVSVHACQYCDMTSPFLNSLALHIRYRHLGECMDIRRHKCHLCDYSAIQRCDLLTHLTGRHELRPSELKLLAQRKKRKQRITKRYMCHMCTEKDVVFLRGARLSRHLIDKHGMEFPFALSKFKYHKSDDGFYRLTLSRYESLEISKQAIKGQKNPQATIDFDAEVDINKIDATVNTPFQIKISFKNETKIPKSMKIEETDSLYDEITEIEKNEQFKVEMEIQDVDEKGNIIRKEVVTSEIIKEESPD